MAFALIAGVVFLALITGAILLWGASAAWVIREVRRADHPNALMWSVGAILLGYFGPVLYLVTQNSARSAVYGTQTD